MKRIKIMLLSFALLAVVGGALAFKAKFQQFAYCTTTLQGNTLDCKLISSATSDEGTPLRYTPAAINEVGQEVCTTRNPQGQIVPLSCTTISSLVEEGIQ